MTDSKNPTTYWRVLKKEVVRRGNETVTNCNALKMLAPDGKMQLTDVADTEQLFRLIQSIPSPKAEPFKLWMAQVAKERLDQMQDPELSIEQAMLDYKRGDYSSNQSRAYICLIPLCMITGSSSKVSRNLGKWSVTLSRGSSSRCKVF